MRKTKAQTALEYILLVGTGTLVANVTWKTDIPSSSTVKFGTVAPPASSVGSTALVTDHKVQLSLPAHQFNFVCVAISCTQGGGCSSAVCDFSLGLPIE